MPAGTQEIPKRDKIEDQHKWNLADIYADENAWEADFQLAQTMNEKAAQFVGKLASASALLFECLETRSNLSKLISRLYQYAHLNKDLDNRVSKFQALTDRAAQLGAKASAAFAFVEPELLKIDEAKLVEMASQFERTDVYDFYIKDLIRSRKHVRTEEVEELLALSSMVARAPDTIFTMLDDADMTYPSIKDEDGNEVQLTKQRYARFLESSDARVRKDANDAFYSSYKNHINTIGASLSASVNKDIFYATARRFDSCLEYGLDGDNIPTSVYRSLLDSTENNLASLHKWTEVRRKVLKLDKIYPYDMVCPLFPETDFDVPYEEAVRQTIESARPLGTKYNEKLAEAMKSRWVDVYETEGKGSGAYSYTTYTAHPFVLMNYNNTVDNLFTLAHEMGHAMHSTLSNRSQPFSKSQYSTFVAEVASTLNEGLLLHYLLERTDDPKMKLYLLNREIDNTFGTFLHQVMYARFELEIHEQVEQGAALSPELLNRLWHVLTEKHYGPHITMDDFTQYKWSRIPHFYRMFYVYQYATSYAASNAILAKFLSGEDGIIEKYLELLSSGGSDYPIELLKKCGIDMTTSAPVEATLSRFSDMVDEVERLAL